MRPLRPSGAAFVCFLLLPSPRLSAQVKTDLGAAATAGAGASASATGGSATAVIPGVVPLSPALSAPTLSPALSAAPAPRLAPAAPAAALVLPGAAAAPAAPAARAPSGKDTEEHAASAVAAPAAAAPAAPSASAAPPRFAAALVRLGVSNELAARLASLLATRHPGDQQRLYHGLAHSQEAGGLMARVVENQEMPADRKILLIVSAALHDLDPERAPGTPARVSATLPYLDSDPETAALLAELGRSHGFTTEQVKALILATDFDPDPVKLKAKQDAFARAAAAAFPDGWGQRWGRALAFVDQSATYVGEPETARQRVASFAGELRALGPGPTDAQMLAGTAKFLGVLRADPQLALLPEDAQINFERIYSYFEQRQTPEAWSAPAAPAPARAPPDVAAARRYVRQIAGGTVLSPRQTDALLDQFFEEESIAPGSPRAEAVRRAVVPGLAARDDKEVARLSPALQPHRAVLLKIAAERRTTPAAISAALERLGVLSQLAELNDEHFAFQVRRALYRDGLARVVAAYPAGAAGALMRQVADAMGMLSGNSVEEVSRDGVFIYADFAGRTLLRATAGRDPDVRTAQMVFYVTRHRNRWRIEGYRQNRETGHSDLTLADALKGWLVAGGIPEADLK